MVGLDIRLPMGLLFSLMGTMLALFGLFGEHEIYHRSLDINVNLIWGLAMMLFGGLCLYLTHRARMRKSP